METFSRISPNQEFFFKNVALWLLYLYSLLTSCKRSEKSLEPFLRKLRYQPTNQPTILPIITNNTDLTGPRWRRYSNDIQKYCLKFERYDAKSYFSEKVAIWRYLVSNLAKIAQIEVFRQFLDIASLVFLDFANNDRWVWCLVACLQFSGPVNVFLFFLHFSYNFLFKFKVKNLLWNIQ